MTHGVWAARPLWARSSWHSTIVFHVHQGELVTKVSYFSGSNLLTCSTRSRCGYLNHANKGPRGLSPPGPGTPCGRVPTSLCCCQQPGRTRRELSTDSHPRPARVVFV